MNKFEKFKSMSIDELVDWLDENCSIDDAPWIRWFDKTYCKKCEPKLAYIPEFDKEEYCGWCELHGKCIYFQDLNNTPDNKQIIKMWLELEAE